MKVLTEILNWSSLFGVTHLSEEEFSNKGSSLTLQDKGIDFVLSQPPQQYFLHSKFCRYHFFVKNDLDLLYVDNFHENDLGKMNIFFAQIANLNPFFGVACDSEEYDHRNRVVKIIGENKIESWVGRNPLNKLPGLYWKIMISKQMIESADLDMPALEERSQEVHLFGNSMSLLTFFSHPQEWKAHVKTLDSACLSIKNVFSRQEVLAETNEIDNVIKYITKMAKWKS